MDDVDDDDDDDDDDDLIKLMFEHQFNITG